MKAKTEQSEFVISRTSARSYGVAVFGARALRLPFATRITNGEEARKELVRLVSEARAKAA